MSRTSLGLFAAGLPEETLDVLSDALLAVDGEGRIAAANLAASRLYGYTRDRLKGADVRVLIPDWDRARRRSPDGVREASAVARDGDTVLVELAEGAAVGTVLVVARTTGLEEQGGPAQLLEGEEEEARSDAVVEAALGEMEAARAAADTFVSNVVHELHGVVRSVQGFASIVLEDFGDEIPQEAARMLERAVAASDRLVEHLDALRRLDRIGRQPLRPTIVDIERLVARARREVVPDEAARIEFQVHPLPEAWGDRDLLQELWRELVQNAVRFSAPREVPRIEVGWSTERSAYWIRDNGIGFDPRQTNRLFEAFQRLHHNVDGAGHGMGLTVAHEIVARHGGRIWAEGSVDAGAVFYLQVPRRRLALAPPAVSPSEGAPQGAT